MTLQEIFDYLFEKHGEEFNWHMISHTKLQDTFVDELKRELGEENDIFCNKIYSLAKCDSNDDVLFLICNDRVGELWRIYHLTYTSDNLSGFPQYEEFTRINDVGEFIENQFINEFL